MMTSLIVIDYDIDDVTAGFLDGGVCCLKKIVENFKNCLIRDKFGVVVSCQT
jgi:hypothetical protein